MAEPAEQLDAYELGAPEDGEEEVEPLVYSDDSENLCFDWEGHPEGDRAIKEVAEFAYETWKFDWDEQQEYRDKQARDWKLFSGDIPDKTWPFEGAANVHVPIYLENVARLHARLMKEIFGNWDAVFSGVPMGPVAKQVADYVTKHTNHQLCHGITGFRREMDRGCLMFLCIGDVFADSFYDDFRKENYHEVLTSDVFTIPFTLVTTRSDLSDVPRKTKILYMYDHELRDRASEWVNIEEVLKAGAGEWDSDPRPEQRMSEAEGKGIHPASQDRTKPHKVLQWEGWVDSELLPGQERPRYMQVIVHAESLKALSITVHEQEDWRDQRRFQQQMQELGHYQAGQQLAEQMATQQVGEATIIQPDLSEEAAGAIAQRARDGMKLQRPPPTWLDDPDDMFAAPEPVRSVPINRFVHAVNMENLSGAHGIGTGAQQAHHNRAANTLTNQFIDQATLNNVPFIVKSSMIQLKQQSLGVPGKMLNADNASPEDIQTGIREIRPGPGNPQLPEAVDKIVERARSSMQSPEVLSGESGKSGETWRGISARIEQATTQLSTIGVKFTHELLAPIAKNNAELNRLFLPDWELQAILLPDKQQTMIPVSSELYAQSFLWFIRADMRFSTKAQRVGEADELLAMAMNNPYLASNPALMHSLVSASFAARDRQDLISLLGQPPPPPPQFLPPPPPPGQGAPPGPPQ